MANLIPRDTFFHDMADFRRNFDQAFNRLLRWPSTQEERTYVSEFLPQSNRSSTRTIRSSIAKSCCRELIPRM